MRVCYFKRPNSFVIQSMGIGVFLVWPIVTKVGKRNSIMTGIYTIAVTQNTAMNQSLIHCE
ncbi:MAG: hypothetical protein PHW34_08045 [Hespellia sp.]|nr:hypothetical protein [Hespellia sp.]